MEMSSGTFSPHSAKPLIAPSAMGSLAQKIAVGSSDSAASAFAMEYHTSCTVPGTAAEHTRSYIQLAQNENVDLIGHSGSAEFVYDYETVIPIFGECGKIVEINAHTFVCRKKSIENCRRIAELCAKHNVPVMVNSDAHSEFEVGRVERALAMLEEIGFPEELIINTSETRIAQYLQSK